MLVGPAYQAEIRPLLLAGIEVSVWLASLLGGICYSPTSIHACRGILNIHLNICTTQNPSVDLIGLTCIQASDLFLFICYFPYYFIS